MANNFCRRREGQIASMRFHALMDDETQRKRREVPVTNPTGKSSMDFLGMDRPPRCR